MQKYKYYLAGGIIIAIGFLLVVVPEILAAPVASAIISDCQGNPFKKIAINRPGEITNFKKNCKTPLT